MKNYRLILSIAFLLIIAAAGAFSVTTRSQTNASSQPPPRAEPPRWEYKIIDGSFGASESKFDRYGAEGWELVGADFDIVNGRSSARRYLFKRRK